MSQYKNKVVCISNSLFLNKQKDKLKPNQLKNNFYAFNDTADVFQFLEKQIENGENCHYLIIDEETLNGQTAKMFNKLTDLNGFMRKMEVIVLSGKENVDLENNIMQYPFVSAYLLKPVPDNYVRFLIDGSS